MVEPGGLLHVGGRNQDAHARPVGPDAVDQLPELAARQRIDAGGRLVEDQQVGVVDQGADQAELLLHAAGQLAGRPVGEAPQPDAVQQLGDAALGLGTAEAEQPGEEVGVLEDRQRRVEVLAQALRHVGDAGAGVPAEAGVGHVAAEHLDPPLLDRRAPATSAIRLDLPTPSGPISPTMQPAGMSRVIASSACRLAVRRLTSVKRATGA